VQRKNEAGAGAKTFGRRVVHLQKATPSKKVLKKKTARSAVLTPQPALFGGK